VVVINSVRDPDYLLKFLPDEMKAKIAKFVVVDAVGLADQRERSPWMFVRNLSELALDRMSTEGAEERLAIGMGIAAPLIGALVAATGVLPVDAVADVVADRDAMLRGADKHAVVQFAGPAPAGETSAGETSAGEPAAGKPGTVQAPAATHVVAR
jgi:oxalate oxidoreductase subunit delta